MTEIIYQNKYNIHMKCVGPNGKKVKHSNEGCKLDRDDKQESLHSSIFSLNKYLFSTWNAPGTKAKYRRYTLTHSVKL